MKKWFIVLIGVVLLTSGCMPKFSSEDEVVQEKDEKKEQCDRSENNVPVEQPLPVIEPVAQWIEPPDIHQIVRSDEAGHEQESTEADDESS